MDNNNKDSFEILNKNKIFDFFIFNKSGICILEKQVEIIFPDKIQYNNYKLLIKNIAYTLLKKSLINNKPKNQIQENNDILNINININTNNNKLNSSSENDFIFQSIQTDKIKILFLIKNSIILVGTFPKTSSTQFQRLLLIHIFIALINFKGDFLQLIKKLNENNDEYDKYNFINLKSFYNKTDSNISSKDSNDILETLIFENYFLKVLIINFSKIFNELFKKEDLNLKQTKFRNLYILEINSLSVILDMCKLQAEKSSKKNKKFYKLENLFEEIIYHSKNLYNEYIRENEMKYSSNNLDFRFVKFECTSTYPRLLFIIKFIPILKGIAVVHIYSQKKLSRNNDNNMQSEQGLNCKEVDLLFGSFIRDNPNFEFKYGAPKKLEHIEKFLEEFFVTGRNGLGIFRITNSFKKYAYVNYDIINIINSFQISNNDNIDQIFNDINKKIEEDYEKEKNKKKLKNDNESDSINEKSDDSSDSKNLNKLLLLNKDNFYKYYYYTPNKGGDDNINNKNKKKIIIIHNDIAKKEEKIEEIKLINTNTNSNIDNLEKNININELINNNNSERKNLIRNENDNKTLSLYTSNNNINNNNNYKINKSISKNSKNDNFSMVSEVKKNEKFELVKVLNIKNVQNKEDKDREKEENKEDTKEKLSSNSSVNEKELKLNELLDLITTSNKKIKQYIKENNKIQEEDFEENELTKKDINSSKIKGNSLSRTKNNKIVLVDKEKKPGSRTSRSSLLNH